MVIGRSKGLSEEQPSKLPSVDAIKGGSVIMHIGGNLFWVGVGIYMIGDGVTKLANPGAYAMIAGGIVVIICALTA
jgi:hypothetical protein